MFGAWIGCIAASVVVLALANCTDKGTEPEVDTDRAFPPPPTAPESLVAAIEVLYNDRMHTADERLAAYKGLLDSAFVYRAPIYDGWDPFLVWYLTEEMAAHRGIFESQSQGFVTSIDLRLLYDPATELDPPDPNREGWKRVFVRDATLRIMFDPIEGLEVNSAQCDFLFPPAVDGRYRIGEWRDLPRPGRAVIEPTTWASIKAHFSGL